MLFRHSVLRALFGLVPMMMGVWALSMLLASAMLGRPADWDVLSSLPLPLVAGSVGFGVGARLQRSRPTWIRVSSFGIELAQRGDPIIIPWSNITAARVRRRWIFAVLEVTPADLYAVTAVLPSRYLPRVHHKRGVPMFRIEVGMIRPGLRDLRAALVWYQQTPENCVSGQAAI
ncbi:hypothetical protein ADL15_07665 [Actinoplanes awajinensis subsp. mycoplanecinus]|uniref:Uncharacterized protein n=1 Tax=Actinoplanes awajinensis subsp. mycoplanecinus TaxID=135947 RepID=A0A0X3VA85_9ACTN|nr:hypothetical protein ADL15_07665 [Actinoplanes awajinensis subsp. mycoplanecinus]